MQSKTRTYTAICVAGTALLALISVAGNSHIDNLNEVLIGLIIGIPFLSAVLIGTFTAIDAILHTSDFDASDGGGKEHRKHHNIPIIMSVLAAVWNLAVTAVVFARTGDAYIILFYPSLVFVIVQTVLYCCCMLMHKHLDEEIRVVPLVLLLTSAVISLMFGLHFNFIF